MARAQTFFVWVLPLWWAACSLAQSKFPGDEYGFFVASSIPAAWMAPFLLLARVSKEAIPIYVVLAGTPVMAGVGWMMDRLQIRRVLWAIFYLAGGIAAFCLVLGSYVSLEQAVGKNGSLWAYVLLAFSLGLYASVVLSVIVTLIARAARWSVTIAKDARSAINEPDRHEDH